MCVLDVSNEYVQYFSSDSLTDHCGLIIM